MTHEIDVLDADRARRTIKTIGDLLDYLDLAALAVKAQKVAGQTTWTWNELLLDGTSQQLVAANAGRCGLVVQNRDGNQPIDIDPAGGEIATGKGWLIVGGDPPVALWGAECPAGIVTVIGAVGETITFWEIT